MIERAVITSRDGRLDLDRALPESPTDRATHADAPADHTAHPTADPPIRTAREMQQLERENLRRALQASDWEVSGKHGAAARPGMKPSTLSSRMKALGIERPG